MDGIRELLRSSRRNTQYGGHYIQKFHFSFKQKICQIIQNTENYENALMYSTKEKRIAMNGNDFYVFDTTKIKQYEYRHSRIYLG
jgi:hypothetical protein